MNQRHTNRKRGTGQSERPLSVFTFIDQVLTLALYRADTIPFTA